MADSLGCSMSTLLRRLITQFRNTKGFHFLVIGSLNTLFGLASFSIAISLWDEIWLALMISNVTGIAFNFLTIGGVVFRDLRLARLPRFMLVYMGIYLLNWECIVLLVTFIETNKILAQTVMVIPMALISYILLNHYVFRSALPS